MQHFISLSLNILMTMENSAQPLRKSLEEGCQELNGGDVKILRQKQGFQ